MNQERLMTVLLGPHVSEKGHTAADKHNQIVFRVRRDANKAEIRRAVELMFEVKVAGVQVINCKGKSKRFGRNMGKRSDWKKAYVRLAEGQTIDFIGAD
jgi:large subunit ribosomal protein L23